MFSRKLGSFEQTLVMMDDFAPVLFVGVLRLSNGPSADQLRRAIGKQQLRHPLLRVGIEAGTDGPMFSESGGGPDVPLTVLAREGPEHWRSVAESELNLPMDTATPPLFRCTYLAGEPDSEFIFTFHHTIIDSRAGVSLVDELLTICGGQNASEQETAPLKPLPAMEDLYPPQLSGWRRPLLIARYLAGQLMREVSYRRGLKGRQVVHKSAASKNHVLTSLLDADATRAIVRSARKRRLPLNSLVNAAMLISLARHRYAGERMPMRGLSFANMRPYLQPPPSSQDMGVYISMLPHTVEMAPDVNIWQLAGEIGDQIYAATKAGDKYLAALLSKNLISMLLSRRSMRLGMTALSYAGPIKLSNTYGAIKVRGLSGFVANNVLGPELAAFGTVQNNRLTMDFLYLDADMNANEAQAIVDDVVDLLKSTTNGGQEVGA